MAALRCKLSGCDLDDCGVCRRCGSNEQANHDWKELERRRPCYRLRSCTRCDEEMELPDHDWEPKPGGPDGIQMLCSRCGQKI